MNPFKSLFAAIANLVSAINGTADSLRRVAGELDHMVGFGPGDTIEPPEIADRPALPVGRNGRRTTAAAK